MWRARLADDPRAAGERRRAMDAVKPAYIPRNHRIEAVITAATDQKDFAPFDELLEVVAAPFAERPQLDRYAQPPLEHESVRATFCGT